MILIRNLSKSFDGRKIFNNFDLEIEKGEFIILKGRSGCGKTTLLNMIGGVESIDKGEIKVNNLDVSSKKDLRLLYRNTFGFLFQNFALIDNYTVKENLMVINPKFRNTIQVDEVLEMVGLKGLENRKVYSLSGGEQQRVAIARLMIKKCEVILADEPTGSLDRITSDGIIKLLKNLNNMGKTIVMVTHDTNIEGIGTKLIELGDIESEKKI